MRATVLVLLVGCGSKSGGVPCDHTISGPELETLVGGPLERAAIGHNDDVMCRARWRKPGERAIATVMIRAERSDQALPRDPHEPGDFYVTEHAQGAGYVVTTVLSVPSEAQERAAQAELDRTVEQLAATGGAGAGPDPVGAALENNNKPIDLHIATIETAHWLVEVSFSRFTVPRDRVAPVVQKIATYFANH